MGIFRKAMMGVIKSLTPQATQQPKVSRTPLKSSLEEVLYEIQHRLGHSNDVIVRRLSLDASSDPDIALIYTEGLANTKDILVSLLVDLQKIHPEISRYPKDQQLQLLKNSILRTGDIHDITNYESLISALLSGDTIILLNGCTQAIGACTRDWQDRGINEPASQTVIRGPREGFTETLRTNTMLIRRKIKDENLWLETMPIGRKTRTDVSIMYLKGTADEELVNEVRSRLKRIDMEAVLESAYIEEMIQDDSLTPFPTIYNTERPDVAAAGLLEGRVVILVDGTPFVLLAPALFTHFIQTAEDYYQRADISSLLRLLRYISLFIATLAPAAYIAATTFHQEMIPTTLLIRVAAQHEGIPFPAFIEALIMEIIFEILREAGVRMPRAIGQAVSIVGALVIGQAAVEAGLVGTAMVIIVSLTAISNLVIPSFNMGIAIRMIRFVLMALAASFGLFGILIGLFALTLHLCSLRSFGVPYMAPLAPYIRQDQKDNLIRLPHWALTVKQRLIRQRGTVDKQQPNEN
ncbi:spore germination protein [Paenibacillus pinihumi]|uniref:spore germination protein n=1 Tax=Paenibacillus pinihumi TaxID=669462 RepID=UPI00041A43B6|nr:spore germination protein [Paenibacillus pinihumi]